MVADALGSGLQLLGGWLVCARGALRRVGTIGTEVMRPVLRLAADALTRPPERALPAASGEQGPGAVEPTGPQEQVVEAKYYLGPTREPAAGRYVDREEGELPRTYGRDRIVLLPRDPWWVFAYWEVTPSTRIGALRALGAQAEGAREVLRVYDVTFITFTGDNAWLSFDVDVAPGADHWYLNVGRPAASFCVELGLRTADGRFLPLARSNVVTTPRSSASPDTTVRWVELARGTPREIAGEWRGGRVDAPAPEGATDGAPVGEGPRSSDVHAPPAR
jgi:hypothetical protein